MAAAIHSGDTQNTRVLVAFPEPGQIQIGVGIDVALVGVEVNPAKADFVGSAPGVGQVAGFLAARWIELPDIIAVVHPEITVVGCPAGRSIAAGQAGRVVFFIEKFVGQAPCQVNAFVLRHRPGPPQCIALIEPVSVFTAGRQSRFRSHDIVGDLRFLPRLAVHQIQIRMAGVPRTCHLVRHITDS